MPFHVPPVADEREGLLGFLAQQRDAIRASVYRLTDEQAASKPVASSDIRLAGLLKHVAHTEQHWIVKVMMQQDIPDFPDYAEVWQPTADETLDVLLAFYADVAAETERTVRALPSLDHPVPVPDGPWAPKDVDAWSARWVLLHCIEETARHAGHADIVREAIDGATCFPLLAAYDNGTEVKELTW